jgi:hypothetical protein
VFIRAFLLGSVIAVIVPPRQASAQSTATTPAAVSTPANKASVKRVPISKAVFGDAGMIVNARDDGFIEIAAAGETKTVLIQLRTLAARAWVDSTSRLLRARPRRSNTPRTYRSQVDEYGTRTTMALTRTITAGQSEYALFLSDDPLAGVTIPIEKSEADVFVAIVRKAVTASAKMLEKVDTTARPDSSAPAAPVQKKPAAKKPSPPATTP